MKLTLLALALSTVALVGCDEHKNSDTIAREKQEQLALQGTQTVGMPYVNVFLFCFAPHSFHPAVCFHLLASLRNLLITCSFVPPLSLPTPRILLRSIVPVLLCSVGPNTRYNGFARSGHPPTARPGGLVLSGKAECCGIVANLQHRAGRGRAESMVVR